jgi:hypothetical protein
MPGRTGSAGANVRAAVGHKQPFDVGWDYSLAVGPDGQGVLDWAAPEDQRDIVQNAIDPAPERQGCTMEASCRPSFFPFLDHLPLLVGAPE